MLWSGTMRERGFWQSMPCNQNCPCLLPLHKEVSSQQGRDCLRWSLIYYQISIYIYMQYVWSFCYGIVFYNPFLILLDTSWRLFMSHFTSLAFNLDPWAPDRTEKTQLWLQYSMAVHFCSKCSNILVQQRLASVVICGLLEYPKVTFCKLHLSSCWIGSC